MMMSKEPTIIELDMDELKDLLDVPRRSVSPTTTARS